MIPVDFRASLKLERISTAFNTFNINFKRPSLTRHRGSGDTRNVTHFYMVMLRKLCEKHFIYCNW